MNKSVVSILGLIALASTPAVFAGNPTKPLESKVYISEKAKLSKPLSELAKPLPQLSQQRKIKVQGTNLDTVGAKPDRIIPNKNAFGIDINARTKNNVDTLVQKNLPNFRAQASIDLGVGFEGIGNVTGVAPPDPVGDVGPNHYVQAVNVALAIWDKQGNQILEPVAINTLWEGFGGKCESQNNGDPIVLYDAIADRWMISQFAIGGTDNHECIAISQTSDPTGAYYLYDFPYGELMNDYPKLGVWTDGYYMGVNQFDLTNNGGSFEGGGIAAYEREKMLIGAPAKQVIFSAKNFSPEVVTPIPLDMDGIQAPPEGMNQLFVWTSWEEDAKHVFMYELDVDWDDISASTFTEKYSVEVEPYKSPVEEGVNQPNGSNLTAVGLRTMYRAQYRNMNNKGKVVVNHTVAADDGVTAAVRWYEIEIDHETDRASVLNQGTFAPNDDARWVGSIASDANGNLALGYSRSSKSMHPSIYVATRLAGDAANTLSDETAIIAGGGSQSGSNRWGDYSSMNLDPVDDCTFWYTNQYYTAENNNTLDWSTYVQSFKIPGCEIDAHGTLNGQVVDSTSGAAVAKAKISFGNYSLYTDENGEFSVQVPSQTYQVSVVRYGWVSQTVADVRVSDNASTDLTISLQAANELNVSGRIYSNDSNQLPVYSEIQVAVPGDLLKFYNDPVTGNYDITLFEGSPVTISVNPVHALGYNEKVHQLDLSATSDDQVLDLAIDVDDSCTAPGYQWNTFSETFSEQIFPPTGWSLRDDAGEGVNWQHGTDTQWGNPINTTTDVALVDSDGAGQGVNGDAYLISKPILVSEINGNILTFKYAWPLYEENDAFDLEIKIDDNPWQVLSNLKGTKGQVVVETFSQDLTDLLVGAEVFQLRWRYYDAVWQFYATIDDVFVGNPTCEVVTGQIVTGYTTDANTGDALNDVNITVGDKTYGVSVDTANDDALNDGLFSIFVAEQETAVFRKSGYVDQTVSIASINLQTPVAMAAGRVEAGDSVALSGKQGTTLTSNVVFNNVGGADVTLSLKALPYFDAEDLPNGPFHPSTRHTSPKKLNHINTQGIRNHPKLKTPMSPAKLAESVIDVSGGGAYSVAADPNSDNVWVGLTTQLGAESNANYIIAVDGIVDESSKIAAGFGQNSQWSADMAFNSRTGHLWQVSVGDDMCIYEMSIVSQELTEEKICPSFGVSQRGLAYDPVSNTFFSGSITDSIIHQFDTTGTILRSINVDHPISGLAFNPVSRHLYASINVASEETIVDVIVLDTEKSEMPMVDSFNIQFVVGDRAEEVADRGQAGLSLDCDGNLWLVDMVKQKLIQVASGVENACQFAGAKWVEFEQDSYTVAAGETANIPFTVGPLFGVGNYNLAIIAVNDAPYGDVSLPVTLDIETSNFGKFSLVNTELSVKNGQPVNIQVQRTEGMDGKVDVYYQAISNTALNGEHFELEDGALSWMDGDEENKTLTFETNNLNLLSDRSFAVRFLYASHGEFIGDDTVSITIEKDIIGKLAFSVPDLTVNEGSGTANIVIDRIDGSDRAIVLQYETEDGTAIADTDYRETSGELIWNDGDSSSKTVRVTLLDNDDEQSNRTFKFKLTQASEEVLPENRELVVTIADDDEGRVKGVGSMPLTMVLLLLGILLVRRQSFKF